MNAVTIDVVSDVMCPWCMIGKRKLEAALERLPDLAVEVRWRPYLLDPTLPPEGRDRHEYLERKFGDPGRARAIYARIEAAGRDVGIDFAFERIERSPRTVDAHRLIRWAGGVDARTQDRVVEALFIAFFLHGRDISDHAVLREIAERCGMDGALVADLLGGERETAIVLQEVEQARAMGVTGVPCFIVAGREGLTGAQEPEAIEAAVRRAVRPPASQAGS